MGSLELATPQVLGSVPVNKIEAELYVPEDYAYMGLSGSLHLRPGTDRISNTLAWLRDSLRGETASTTVDAGDSSALRSPQQALGTFTTQGRLFRFQTLAPIGTLSAGYCNRKLYWVIDIAVFLAALAAGFALTRRRDQPRTSRFTFSLPRLPFCIGFTVLPLCISWFLVSDAAEPFLAWLGAALFVSASFTLVFAREIWSGWRQSRLALAPDPFLEEAEAAPSSTEKPAENPAQESAPAAAGPVLVDADGKPIIAEAPAESAPAAADENSNPPEQPGEKK